MWTNENMPRSITPINSSVDILSSSPVDHVDISEHSDRGSSKLILSNGFISTKSDIVTDEHSNDKTIVPNEVTAVNDDDEDITDNEIEWNWDQEGREEEQDEIETIIEEKIETPTRKIVEKPATNVRPKIVDNIDDLDIKNKKLTKLQEQAEDFFSDFDMTPTFKTSNVHVVQQTSQEPDNTELDSKNSSRLQMSAMETVEGGWGDDENWNDDEGDL
jgi:hypothetical protein